MPNTNCLEGFKCPKCNSEGPFRIEVSTVMTVTDNGTEGDGADHEWDENSYCECPKCDYANIVKTFRG